MTRTRLRRFARVAAALILALIAAMALLLALTLALVDREALSRRVADLVSQRLGRELRLSGELGVSLFPPALTLGPGALAGEPGAPDLAGWDLARLGPDIPALLQGRLALSSLRVESPRLVIPLPSPGTGTVDASTSPPDIPALELGRLSLVNARLTLLRAQRKDTIRLDELRAGPIGPGRRGRVEARGGLALAELNATFACRADLEVSESLDAFQLNSIETTAEISRGDQRQRLTLAGELELRRPWTNGTKATSIQAALERLDLAGGRVSGRADWRMDADGEFGDIELSLRSRDVRLDPLLAFFGLAWPRGLPDGLGLDLWLTATASRGNLAARGALAGADFQFQADIEPKRQALINLVLRGLDLSPLLAQTGEAVSNAHATPNAHTPDANATDPSFFSALSPGLALLPDWRVESSLRASDLSLNGFTFDEAALLLDGQSGPPEAREAREPGSASVRLRVPRLRAAGGRAMGEAVAMIDQGRVGFESLGTVRRLDLSRILPGANVSVSETPSLDATAHGDWRFSSNGSTPSELAANLRGGLSLRLEHDRRPDDPSAGQTWGFDILSWEPRFQAQ